MPTRSFRSDIYALGVRVQSLATVAAPECRAATDSRTVVNLLNEALAIETACVMRFESQYSFAGAERIAIRISELGGSPNHFPDVVRAHTGHLASTSCRETAQEDVATERLVMAAYCEILEYIGNSDFTTRGIVESVLARHTEHVAKLVEVLKIYNKPAIRRVIGTAVPQSDDRGLR